MITIRKIQKKDNKQLKHLIIDVMTEYGASGEGFSLHDKEIEDMYSAYTTDKSVYYVIVENNNVLGGAGIGILSGEEIDVCELKKMYFNKRIRGKGFGNEIIDLCLKEAKSLNYSKCYIETLNTMLEAKTLYLKKGFNILSKPLGNTGHFGCDTWLQKDI